MHRVKKHERLVLDETGITYESAVPAFLPGWHYFWTEIRSAELVIPKLVAPNLVSIELDAGERKRRVHGVWAPEGTVLAVMTSSGWGLKNSSALADELARELEASPLVQYLRSRGIPIRRKSARISGFALESHRATWIGTLAFLSLVAYTVGDLFLNAEVYAVEPPLVLFVLAGFAAAMACVVLIGRYPLPRMEAWALSLLLGGAVGVALYPALLRLNQITDADGLKPYQFTLVEHVLLRPDNRELPEIRFRGYPEYWQQFRVGTKHELVLRRGGLGFWQLDRAPLHARMREFYVGKGR
jgi:hypothetical protein